MWSVKHLALYCLLQHLHCQCHLFQDIWLNLPINLLPLMMTCLINKLDATVLLIHSCACLAIVYMYVVKLAYTICNITSQNGQYFLFDPHLHLVVCYFVATHCQLFIWQTLWCLLLSTQIQYKMCVVSLTYYSNNSATYPNLERGVWPASLTVWNPDIGLPSQ